MKRRAATPPPNERHEGLRDGAKPGERPLRTGVFGVISVVLHGVLAAGVVTLAYHSLHAREEAERAARANAAPPAELELPRLSEIALEPMPDPVAEPPARAGGTTVAQLDTGVSGHGGTGATPTPAIHLDDRDERIRLSPDLRSHLDHDQEQRLRTDVDRASWEDRRSTTHPMELTFLASGRGEREARRVVAPRDPSRGVLAALAPSRRGGALGGPLGEEGVDDGHGESGLAHLGTADLGGSRASPGVGVDDGRVGADHRASAAVMRARPAVTEALVSIPATSHARPRDDVDSDQAVAVTVQSLVHASTAGGLRGESNGGSEGGGDPGAGGGPTAGSHPIPLGPGDGDWFDLDGGDPRLLDYFRKFHRKVDPLWANAFPKSAMLELKQGMVILEVVISPDGNAKVLWPPLRPSGIDEFDRNCADAVRRAGPFDPVPASLGHRAIRVRAPFVASNPIVK